MNIVEFTSRFHKLELEGELFAFKDGNGLNIWDPVRFHVFHLLYSRLSGGEYIYGMKSVKPALPKKLLKRLIGILAKWSFYARCFMSKKMYLQILSSREKCNNSFVDTIQTQLDINIQDKAIKLETSSLKNTIIHSKFLLTSEKFVMDQLTNDFIHMVEDAFLAEFKIKIQLENVFLEALTKFNAQYCFYKALFKWKIFKTVFVVQNGITKGMFYAANEFDIPVYEFQHGYIGYTHIAYSYPSLENIDDNVYLPKVLLTYSDFWQVGIYMPEVKMVTIGSKNHGVVSLSSSMNSTMKVLVTSSILHHDNLSALLKLVANELDTTEFIYKLHPNQFFNIRAIEKEFSKFSNVKVISNTKNMSECLSDCKTMICVQTTAVYEALQSRVFVCCYNRQDCNFHDNVVDVGGFSFFDNAEELITLIEKNEDQQVSIMPEFFSEYNRDSLNAILPM